MGETGEVTPSRITTPTLKDAQCCKAKILWQCLCRLPFFSSKKQDTLEARSPARKRGPFHTANGAFRVLHESDYVHVHGWCQPGLVPAQPLASRCRPGLTPQLPSGQPSPPSAPLSPPSCILHSWAQTQPGKVNAIYSLRSYGEDHPAIALQDHGTLSRRPVAALLRAALQPHEHEICSA